MNYSDARHQELCGVLSKGAKNGPYIEVRDGSSVLNLGRVAQEILASDWLDKIESEAAERALSEIAKDSEALEEAARDGMNSRGGPYPWNAAKGVRDMLHARAAEIREGK